MILYATHVTATMLIISILILVSVYFQFIKKNPKIAFSVLIFTSIVLRLFMASVDPFLQDWDERFHALVAKNFMNNPFLPLLRKTPIMPYEVESWCCNHIWVHKQPLFMWQMALSMIFFGINEIAMRIPSVIMGTISIYFVYDIAKKWINNQNIAYLSALFIGLSYYQLELTSGRFSLDQNDLTFAFYVTASIWAFVRYLNYKNKLYWAILIGVFVGCAVLNKWLTGILIYGGWGLYLIMDSYKKIDWKKYSHIILSILVSLAIFLPWQFYILKHFPLESSIMYDHNRRHIFEALDGHQGTIWFHFHKMRAIYGEFSLIFIPIGIYSIVSDKKIKNNLSIVFLVMILVIYSFFSFIVQTKMPAFTFPVNSLIWIIVATGTMISWNYFFKQASPIHLAIFIFILAVFTLQPWEIIHHRSLANTERNKKIENTKIYKSLDVSKALKGRVILNCKSFEDTELMFYQDVNAYHWYPKKQILDSLLQKGYKFAAFKNHNNQNLPDYILSNKEIIIIDKKIN